MKTIYNIAIILNVVLISVIFYSCASTYRSNFLEGVPTVTQLDQNVFRISFNSDREYEIGYGYMENELWQIERNYDVVMLKSAEVTHKNGYNFFIVMDEKQYKTPSDYVETKYLYPQLTNIIICFKEKPKDFSYNANFIIDSIQKKYAIK